MPEITDQELLAAQQALRLLATINGNPEARAHMERGLKVLDPKIETAEDIQAKQAAPLLAQIEELKKRLDDDVTARETRTKEDNDAAALGRLESSFADLRARGLTTEGEERVKQIMVERGVADPEAAFLYFESKNPKPVTEAAGWVPDQWRYDTDAVTDTKALFADPERWGDEMIGQVLLDERKRSSEG